MGIYISFIFILNSIVFFFLLRKNRLFFSSLNKNKISLINFSLIILASFFFTSVIYIKQSNLWIGDSVLNKIKNNQKYTDLPKIDVEQVFVLLNQLEKELEKNPTNIEVLERLGKVKYLIGDFDGALIAYKSARKIAPNNLNLLKGEANVRLIFEKVDITKSTLDLFERILKLENNNPLALLILADQAFKENNLEKAKTFYSKLIILVKENSNEYFEISDKLEKVKEKLNEENKK